MEVFFKAVNNNASLFLELFLLAELHQEALGLFHYFNRQVMKPELLWGESKLSQRVCSDSHPTQCKGGLLTPRPRIALCMCITSHRPGDGPLCVVRPSELPQESPGAAATREPCHGHVTRGYVVATSLLHHAYAVTASRRGAGFGYRVSQGGVNNERAHSHCGSSSPPLSSH